MTTFFIALFLSLLASVLFLPCPFLGNWLSPAKALMHLCLNGYSPYRHLYHKP
jgi:hypothetical protein